MTYNYNTVNFSTLLCKDCDKIGEMNERKDDIGCIIFVQESRMHNYFNCLKRILNCGRVILLPCYQTIIILSSIITSQYFVMRRCNEDGNKRR